MTREEVKLSDQAVITNQMSSLFELGVAFQVFFANKGKAVLIALFIFAGDL